MHLDSAIAGSNLIAANILINSDIPEENRLHAAHEAVCKFGIKWVIKSNSMWIYAMWACDIYSNILGSFQSFNVCICLKVEIF